MASASMSNNSREYCLRWNNHQPNMATYFSSLYSSESLVDVTLVSAEGNKVLCHKLVLSACSPYFQHIFESNPCRHPVVILKDVQHSDLEAIVKFIYNGEVNISQDRMTPILKTANSLQVKGLAEVPADELKRVSSVVGGSGGDPLSSLNRPHKTPLLASSLSWDTSDSAHDIPRKKLKKSASTSYASGSLNTNGDHSTSVDSGVGASVSKSIDESSPPDETPPTVLHKRVSIPAPPPLLPKSRSLDLHRDDHEMNMAEHHQRQSYDDSSVDRFDRDSTIDDGERRRRGRPLLRQPRIKRSDNEPSSGFREHISGSELYGRDPLGGGGGDDSNDDSSGGGDGGREASFERRVTTATTTTSQQREVSPQRSSIHSSNLPIVRVSSCSPTPPSSPLLLLHPPPLSPSSPAHYREDDSSQPPVIVSNTSVSIASSATGYSGLNPSCSSSSSTSTMVITPTHHTHQHNSPSSNNTLLKVPSTESVCVTNHPSPVISPTTSSTGNQLVKQISQPSLPSQQTLSPMGFSSGNAVIRRQNSSPATATGQQQQSRIVQPLKHGTLAATSSTTTMFQVRLGTQPNAERSSSEDNSSTSKAFIIDLMPPVVVGKEGGDMGFPRRELKKDSSGEHSGSFSREDSTSEDIGSSTSSSSFDDGLPVNRSGHCPALRPGPALGCNFCWNSIDNCGRILRRKTKYHCPECHINLCIVPCFQEYHEKADKKKRPRSSKLGLPKPSSM
ncbi:broad-complex core protein isoforms 1/2/3/4/5 isoform X1 [Folsomia candida]|uniref:broad-complex core protein isoforms 1/2/3/4/5 isoform X1 n=1 Tax=Folsomia candida TaxID=158441 RepID=UPI000B9046D0|nr:broad-complex core protein isoforms 1/2/3/4/5 isoform X1 [Folsomia candida]